MTRVAFWILKARNPKFLLILVSFITALLVLIPRSRIVGPFGGIEIALDLRDIEPLLGTSVNPERPDDLERLKKLMATHGFSTLSIPQATLRVLERQGRASVYRPGELRAMSALGLLGGGPMSGRRPGGVFVLIPSSELREKAIGSLGLLLGPGRVMSLHNSLIFVHGVEKELLDLPLAFLAADPDSFSSSGIRVSVVLSNPPGVNEEYVVSLLNELGAHRSVDTVLFEGKEALGYPSFCTQVGAFLEKNMVRPATFEGEIPEGFEKVMEAAPLRAVKSFEVRAYHSPGNLVLAAEERGIRLFCARLAPPAQRSPTEAEMLHGVVSTLSRELEGRGFEVGMAGSYGPYRVPVPCVWILSLGALASAFAAASLVYPGVRAAAPKAVVGTAAGMSICLLTISLFPPAVQYVRELCALLAGVSFPAIAVLCGISVFPVQGVDSRGIRELGRIVLAVLVAAFVSFLGGSIIAALLGDVDYAFQARLFRGVKLTYIIPLSLVLLADSELRKALLPSLERRVDVRFAVLLAVALACCAVYLGRSGNSPIIPVLDLEVAVRGYLESALGIRPRFKEFLIGYPAFVVGLYLAARGRRRLSRFFYLGAAIGQVSVINSFAHLHTPVEVSALRTLYGIVLGVAVGFLLIALIAAWESRGRGISLPHHRGTIGVG